MNSDFFNGTADGEGFSPMQNMAKQMLGLPGMPADPRAIGAPSEPTADQMEKHMEAVRFSKSFRSGSVD